MYRVTSLTDEEIRKIGDAYANYTYSEGEAGMTPFYRNRNAVSDYICGFVHAMIKNGCLYTTGPEHEGYIAYYPSWKMMKPAAIAELLRTFRSTLGLRGVRELVSKLSAGGESYEDSLKKAKQKYIFVALVAVPEEHQGKGHMRKLLEFAFERGRENNCPVVLDTDDALKKAKYEHLGMKNVRTRKIADDSFMYDLVWEPDGSPEAAEPSRKERIRSAYKVTGGHAGFYDGMMTYSTLPGKAICRAVWNMDAEKNLRYIETAFSGIPEDFSGRLLEVPVGTGVLSMPVYRELPDADITCLDYSADMMSAAKEKADAAGIHNISFVQGDVGNLPFEDKSFDIVLSLNGFHAFPDKEAAYAETFRVLRDGGVFCGCFYVKGECSRTDWFIKNLYQPKGFFTPPYETEESLRRRLENMYSEVKVTAVEGIGCFCCRK